MCRSADNHKITSNTYYTLPQVFRLCNALSEIIRRGGGPYLWNCGIDKTRAEQSPAPTAIWGNCLKSGRAEPCPYDRLGKPQKMKITGLSEFMGIRNGYYFVGVCRGDPVWSPEQIKNSHELTLTHREQPMGCSADNHKITSNTYYTLPQVFRLCNALSEIIRRGGGPYLWNCGIDKTRAEQSPAPTADWENRKK